MKTGLAVLIANVPALVFGAIGGLLADRGHPWFGGAFFFLALILAHSVKGKDGG